MSVYKSLKYLDSAVECLLTGTKNKLNDGNNDNNNRISRQVLATSLYPRIEESPILNNSDFVQDGITFWNEQLESKYNNANDFFVNTNPYDENSNAISRENVGIINKAIRKGLRKNNMVKNIIKNVADGNIIIALKEALQYSNFAQDTKVIQYSIDNKEPNILFHEKHPEHVNVSIEKYPEYLKIAYEIFYEKFQERRTTFANSSHTIDTMFDIILYNINETDAEPSILLIIDTFIKDIYDNNNILGIHTHVEKLDLILEKKNTIPYPLTQYINQINSTLKNFVNGEEDQVTTVSYGPVSNINEFKVIASATNPEWDDTYINELKMNGSNFDVRELFISIIRELNNDFGDYNDGDTSISLIKILDEDFLSMNKIVFDGNKRILQLFIVNITDVIRSKLTVVGDSTFNGNILVGKSNEDYMIKTNNTTNTTLINSKVGINQKEYEMSALLDIDNLTNEQLINLINDFAPNLMNSYFLSNKFKTMICDNYTINDTEIIEQFKNNAEIFSFKEQCYVIKCKVLPELDDSDIVILNSPQKDPLLLNNSSPNFMKLLQRNIREILQMKTEIQNNNNQDEIFSYMELFTNNELSNFLLSMKCNLHSIDEVLITITYQNIDYIMNDPSYNGTATTFFNYISSFTRFANFCTLLVKNVELQKIFFEGDSISSFSNAIDKNVYFSDRLGLLSDNDFFLYETFGDRTFVFVESVPMWNGITTNYFWNKEVSIREITDKIDTFYDINYGNEKMNHWFPITYKFNGKREISIIYRTEINGKIYTFGSGDEINRIITKGVKVRSDVVIDGDININDANNNTIFKVDNIDKKITNAYKVGIGMDYPKSILDIQDLTLNEYKKYVKISIEQRYELNRVANVLKTNNSLSESIITDIINTELPNQSPENYYALNIINLQSLNAESARLIYHHFIPELCNKNMDTIKANLRTVLQLHYMNLNQILNTSAIFDGSTGSIVGNGIAGPKRYRFKFFTIEGVMFLLVSGSNLNEYNYRYNTNENSRLLSNSSTVMVLYANNILARLINNNTSEITNYQEETSVLNKLKRETRKITFVYNYIQIDKNNITKSTVGTFNYDTLNISDDNIIVEQLNDNDRFKMIQLISSIIGKTIHEKNLYSTTYEDKTNMYRAFYIPVSIKNNIMTIYTVEFSPSKILIPTLNVVGDCNIVGNSTITNENTLEKYIEMDPHKKTFLVNTSDQFINYGNMNYADVNQVYGSKHNMIVANDTYPNMTCERVAELEGRNDFSTYSAATMKRKSNLYSLQEMKDESDALMEKYKDKDYKPKYGPDISFEVEDKTNNTIEIGQIAMTIDDVDKSGNIKGGFGVYTNTNNADADGVGNFESSRKTILYVDNEGTLEVKKIKLGNKLLSVDANGNLKVE